MIILAADLNTQESAEELAAFLLRKTGIKARVKSSVVKPGFVVYARSMRGYDPTFHAGMVAGYMGAKGWD
jgi:hypothetical protein